MKQMSVFIAMVLLISATVVGSALAVNDGFESDEKMIKSCVAKYATDPNLVGKIASECQGMVSKACTKINGEAQMALNACAAQEAAVWNKVLEVKYQEILAKTAPSAEPEVVAGDAKYKASLHKLLQESQAKWVAYKDSECDFQAAGYDGGSLEPLIYSSCEYGKTVNRLVELIEVDAAWQ